MIQHIQNNLAARVRVANDQDRHRLDVKSRSEVTGIQ